MGISHYIKEIGRGKDGARSLTREQATDLFGQVLDGQVSDLEIGAFCLAMRIKGETSEEMCGFLDATHQRLALLPATDRPLIVLPSYNGARKLPVLTPLLALLLAREGLPVLLHGMRTEARRILASDVLLALDCAASEFYKDGKYDLSGEGLQLTSVEFANYLSNLVDKLSQKLLKQIKKFRYIKDLFHLFQ